MMFVIISKMSKCLFCEIESIIKKLRTLNDSNNLCCYFDDLVKIIEYANTKINLSIDKFSKCKSDCIFVIENYRRNINNILCQIMPLENNNKNLNNKDRDLFIDITKIQINDAIVRITEETESLKQICRGLNQNHTYCVKY
ncbi:putative ORFan [Tupanvirus deep ocean]|uniref:ORFan n=2 Tax=Tupanvirus TaxID=2094720 RepID=A0AC62A8K4_9VIRU|nr:putative ORFan [Tupanvirus deep ocean]QKU34054.1 putative ORFan [Tupanvirus deep ocean]